MRKIVVYELLSLDGVAEDPDRSFTEWDEAMDAAAAGFRRGLDTHGSDSVGIFSCSRTTNEMNYLAGKLARTIFRNHHIDSCNRT